MDANTEAIVRLCFARQLGLADDALEADGRVTVVRDDQVMTLRLWRTSVLVGPAPLLPALTELDADALADPSALLSLCGTGRVAGAARLSVLDELDRHPDLDRLEVDPDPEAATALEQRCPPDDVTEVGLSRMDAVFVHRAPDGTPCSGAGYAVWAGLVANLGVLSALEARRRGLARVLAGIAVNDALDAGLVPAWRVRPGNAAAERLGDALGFIPVGDQVRVELTPG
ncbi:GNAT family N-acetyltransferase [Desertihabitans aurantiacus]|uniref:GNAT family N-acetyltransferase n=1 Tax=Desertihabitans aurantiacus TaxID=2282477 RepID=UPI0013007D6C|nr:GNAT family N-acetyltransferase [Desertihabitans aurantiacus]